MHGKKLNISSELYVALSNINLIIPSNDLLMNNFIQMRSHWFIKDKTSLPKCIKIIELLLNNNFDENLVVV